MALVSRSWWLLLALLSPAGWSCCVAASTRVRTPDGEVAAGMLAVGDRVVSIDVATGLAVEGTIVHVRRAIRECVALRWRGGELVCTPDHPLYSPERGGYRPASDWVDGAARMLLIRTGERAEPIAVEACERFAGVHEVVDLSLAGEPRNFVAAGVIVHNKTIDAPAGHHESLKEDGPTFELSATSEPRWFRIRTCDEPNSADLDEVTLIARAASKAAPASGNPMSLAVSYVFVSEETVLDAQVPATPDPDPGSWSLPVTCGGEFVVGFERVDNEPDGTITVSWELEVGYSMRKGAPVVTIMEE